MRNSYGNAVSPLPREAEFGSITLPFLFLSVILASAVTASVGVDLLWKSKVSLQLRIDACVERTARELSEIQNSIESSNVRMQIERAAAAAAAIPSAGASLESVKPILFAEVGIQELLRMKWRARQASWIALAGCDRKGDLFLPLPNLKWWRPPDDPVGALPLAWEGEKKSGLVIRLWKSNRDSAARVKFGNERGGGNENRWHANWTSLY